MPTILSNTISRLLVSNADRHGARPALLWKDGRRLSHVELAERVRAASDALRRCGVRAGERVAAVLPQPGATQLAFLAVSEVGAFCPLNPEYTREEFERLLRALRATCLLLPAGLSSPARSAAGRLDIRVIDWTLKDDFRLPRLSELPGASHETASIQAADDDDIALILHTSGTTAEPKVVALTQAQLIISAQNLVESLELTGKDRCLSILPPFHVGALVDLLLAPLLSGGAVILGEGSEPGTVFHHLRESNPTWIQAVPTMLQALLRQSEPPAIEELQPDGKRGLRFIRSVSAPLPVSWLEEAENRFKVPIVEIYGMTETAGLICSNPLRGRKAGSVGLPVGQEVCILDEAGNPAPPGKSGEVLVRGPNVFRGYETDGTARRDPEAFLGEWFRTGDQGYFDPDGYLFLTGRIKELINRGGEKISPHEIDRLAVQHPGVLDAACFAVPHETLGEEPALAVVGSLDALSTGALRDYLSQHLASFKIPRTITVLPSLPRNPAGKIMRHRLSRQFGGEDAPRWRPPVGEPAVTLARIWQKVLKVPKVGMQDNFFDLGGDSLSARTMLTQLRVVFGCDLPVSALFENPTIATLAEQVRGASVQADGGARGEGPASNDLLPESFLQQLRACLAAWQGRRRSPDSLLVGLNTLGDRPPLFWCGQGFVEIRRLAEALGADQPIYGMRSTLQIEGRLPEHNEALAGMYVEEILDIQPSGDVHVGGFCEGGRIAVAVAQAVKQAGRKVASLCLHDHFPSQPYGDRVALLYGRPDKYNPYGHYLEPERGWHQFLSGPVSLHRFDLAHYDDDDDLGELGRCLRKEMDLAAAGQRSPKEFPLDACASEILPAEAYRSVVTLESSLPKLMSPGESRVLRVSVTNNSPVPWPPTVRSGIVLSARWFNKKGDTRSLFDGRTQLETPVSPGATVSLELHVHVPRKPGGRVLVIDLADDGVTWFQDRGGRPHRASLRVLPGGRLLGRLLPFKADTLT